MRDLNLRWDWETTLLALGTMYGAAIYMLVRYF